MKKISKTTQPSGKHGLRRISQNRCSCKQIERAVQKYGEIKVSQQNSDFWPFNCSRMAKLDLADWSSDA